MIAVSILLIAFAEPPYIVNAEENEIIEPNVVKDPNFTTYPHINAEIESSRAVKIKELERQQKIDKVEAIFAKYGGYMSGYGHIFVDRAEECGGDYKVLVGIAGNESGMGRINYKLYNPFGYLNNRQYLSYEEALTHLTCEISQRYLSRCSNNLYCIVTNGYGGSDTDVNKWIRNVNFFINQI